MKVFEFVVPDVGGCLGIQRHAVCPRRFICDANLGHVCVPADIPIILHRAARLRCRTIFEPRIRLHRAGVDV
jgi:hypothetical protein